MNTRRKNGTLQVNTAKTPQIWVWVSCIPFAQWWDPMPRLAGCSEQKTWWRPKASRKPGWIARSLRPSPNQLRSWNRNPNWHTQQWGLQSAERHMSYWRCKYSWSNWVKITYIIYQKYSVNLENLISSLDCIFAEKWTYQLSCNEGQHEKKSRSFSKRPASWTCHKNEGLADNADLQVYCGH